MMEAQAQLTAFWRGQTRRFEIALFEELVYFWEPDSKEFQSAPDEWRFCVEGQIGLSDPDLLPDVLPYWLE